MSSNTSEGERSNVAIKIRVDIATKRRIVAAAEREGVTVSAYLTNMVNDAFKRMDPRV